MNCIIIAGGSFQYDQTVEKFLKKADLIIAADGGANHLEQTGVLPHVIIGDLDSIHARTKAFYREKKVAFIPYPARKNNTDTDLCICFALKKGATDITLAGATGSRLDHTLTNVFLLRKMADLNVRGRVIDAHNELYLLNGAAALSLELEGTPGDLVSIIPISETVEGVTLEGLEYPLSNETLSFGSSLGISNYFKKDHARITIRNGSLIVTRSKD